jgi:predicted DNA-binding transcriptional regulator AlpA
MEQHGNSDGHDNSQEPFLLTTEEAARLCGIGTRTLWRWSRSGICPPPIKIGRGLRAAVRYRRGELLQWIADGCPRAERGQR